MITAHILGLQGFRIYLKLAVLKQHKSQVDKLLNDLGLVEDKNYLSLTYIYNSDFQLYIFKDEETRDAVADIINEQIK